MNCLARLKGAWRPILRWSFLVDAIVLAALGLLTVFRSPIWLGWVVGMVVPEIGVWLALAATGVAASAWALHKGNRTIAAVTVLLSAAACALMLKPAAQAWGLGRRLPDQLTAAFDARPGVPAPGARAPDPCRTPFSFAAVLVGREPAPVAIEPMAYSDGLLLDFYRPPGRRGPVPCVIVIHGGSWVSGNRINDGTKRWLNDFLAGRGYAVASIDLAGAA